MDDDNDLTDRCLADVVAEFEGVPTEVWTARNLVSNWLAHEMPLSVMSYALADIHGDRLPHIATQCARDDGTDKMIRVLSRQRTRLGDDLPKPYFG